MAAVPPTGLDPGGEDMGNLPLSSEPGDNARSSGLHRPPEPFNAQQMAVMRSAIEDSHFSSSSMPDF